MLKSEMNEFLTNVCYNLRARGYIIGQCAITKIEINGKAKSTDNCEDCFKINFANVKRIRNNASKQLYSCEVHNQCVQV